MMTHIKYLNLLIAIFFLVSFQLPILAISNHHDEINHFDTHENIQSILQGIWINQFAGSLNISQVDQFDSTFSGSYTEELSFDEIVYMNLSTDNYQFNEYNLSIIENRIVGKYSLNNDELNLNFLTQQQMGNKTLSYYWIMNMIDYREGETGQDNEQDIEISRKRSVFYTDELTNQVIFRLDRNGWLMEGMTLITMHSDQLSKSSKVISCGFKKFGN